MVRLIQELSIQGSPLDWPEILGGFSAEWGLGPCWGPIWSSVRCGRAAPLALNRRLIAGNPSGSNLRRVSGDRSKQLSSTYTSLHYHIVFSTKHRHAAIDGR